MGYGCTGDKVDNGHRCTDKRYAQRLGAYNYLIIIIIIMYKCNDNFIEDIRKKICFVKLMIYFFTLHFIIYFTIHHFNF